MEEILSRIWSDLGERVDGPMSFRLFLQPTMATFFGIRDGLRFAREKRSFLLWGGPTDPAERKAQFRSTWRSIGKVFILAIVLDVIFQILVFRWFYPAEALIVALVVAIVPYLIVRGIMNALARRWRIADESEKKP